MNKFTDIKINSSIEPVLSETGRTVLERRYMVRDEKGDIIEDTRGLFERVARFIASGDQIYNEGNDINETATTFYEMMAKMEFLPNSPTLMNAGRPKGQLAACFVLPVEDSMEGIFESLKNMALIHKSGGGTGFSFSSLRPKNDIVRSTAGVSSGPVSFMNIFNTATETVKQGGTRRGANMAILRIDHPDIIDFIEAKKDLENLTNFNISVAITEKFMEAVRDNEEYELISPKNGEITGKLKASEVYDRITRMAWQNGEPGIIFIDRINEKNPLKDIGDIESTNPCGEQPLLPYESCNLGSINLSVMVEEDAEGKKFNFNKLRKVTRHAVHFLDNVIDLNAYPLEIIAKNTQANRKIGLGVMGYADTLIKLGLSYSSEEAVELAGKIMSAIQEESTAKSEELAKTRGAFPNFKHSEYAKRKEAPLRNATTTTIAPTGTISILANTSSGIEPIFALAYIRNIMDDDRFVEVNPLFKETLIKELGSDFDIDSVMEKVADDGTATGVEEIPEELQKIFITAHEVSPEWHLKTQAAFQKHVDNAVSKTVNFHKDATVEQIKEAYDFADSLGCKGITVYRDCSRENQVLIKNSDNKAEEKKEVQETREIEIKAHSPRPRSEVTWGATRKMTTGCGSLYVTINEDEQGIFEVFAAMGKGGGCAASQTEGIGRLISLSLRSGIPKEQIVRQLRGVRCPNQAWEKGGRIYSCSDAIAKAIERYSGLDFNAFGDDDHSKEKSMAETNGKGSDAIMTGVCPECHGPLEYESGCSVCRSCGFSRCG